MLKGVSRKCVKLALAIKLFNDYKFRKATFQYKWSGSIIYPEIVN
jgi:hypothetical protein